ncbi:unnamed protein product [Cylindrotheca closterium]|uniref:PAS domain-containing protein n=1 Tax=Cylindrotheca closterium TaxID=2856 RepID=A0AAD2FIN0_9STRA|nr:unnamed protein product [Cylindrotheca closterium]
MTENQRLQTFAALCAGQSDAPTDKARDASSAGAQNGDSKNSIASALSSSASSSTTQQSQHAQVAGRTSHPAVQNGQQLQNMRAQELQQALARAASHGGTVSPSLAAAQSLFMQGGLSTQHINDAAVTQMALQQYLQQAQQALSNQQASQTLSTNESGSLRESHALMMAALTGGKTNPFGHVRGTDLLQQKVIPSASPSNLEAPTEVANAIAGAGNVGSSSVPTSMKPPPPPSQKSVEATLSTAGIPSILGQTPPKIAPMPGAKPIAINEGGSESSVPSGFDDKKQQKRAANRRSAQLSRKRKKQYIEELKEENDELRRKEQILRSIPDLIVVFDSSGKLGFVSPSVSRFIGISPDELVGTSFWDRLCESSVRLLKSAFMDALAAKKSDSDTCPLGSGVWDLRLVDKESNYTLVSLNGVVHFSGEAPECVCCIRPLEQQQPVQKMTNEVKKQPTARPVSSCDGSSSSNSSRRDALEIRANPNQSVISSDATSADDSGMNSVRRKKPRRREVGRGAEGESVRISDGDSVSGSDDGIVSN